MFEKHIAFPTIFQKSADFRKNLRYKNKPKTISRKNPCDFFRLKIGEKVEDDGPYLPNLKYGLKPFSIRFRKGVNMFVKFKLKNRVLIDGKEGSGKTWFCREFIDNFLNKGWNVSLLAYVDYHEGDVVEFGEKYEGKADLVVALSDDKKENILDILLSEQKQRLDILNKCGVMREPLQIAVFDECGHFEGEQREKLIKVLQNADKCNQIVLMTYQHKPPMTEAGKYFNTKIHIDRFTHKPSHMTVDSYE